MTSRISKSLGCTSWHVIGIVCGLVLHANPAHGQSPVPGAAAANAPRESATFAPAQAPDPGEVAQLAPSRVIAPEPPPDVLPYDPSQPIPAGYELQYHIRVGLVIAGAITGGIGYTLSAAVGIANTETDFQRRWLILPVLGPFIGMATIRKTCAREEPTLCSKSSTTVNSLAFLGTMQVVGGALFTIGELVRTPRLVLKDGYAVRLLPAPMGQAGYGLAAIGTW